MNADTLLHWLLRTSLEASLLILAVLGLRLMLGTRLSPAWRIGLWMLVGAKLMLPAFIPAGFGLGGWFQQQEAAPLIQTPAAQPIVAMAAVKAAETGSLDTITAAHGSAAPVKMPSAFTLMLMLWVAGAALVIAAALYRQHRFNRVLQKRPAATAALLRALVASLSQKAGIRQPVRVLLMPAGTTPAIVGISQPCILLPEDWDARFDEHSLRHVLLHELLHVKQHDLIWNWVATAVQALHWFNPLVWFVVSRFQADRELRCDAGALEMLSPTERIDYGHTLLRIQESFIAPPAMAGLAPCVRNHPTLRQRIHMIAHPTARQPVLQLMLAVTLSALVCYSFTTARAAEKEVPAKERSRDGARAPAAEQGKAAPGEEGAATGTKKSGDGDGGSKKPGMREGDGGSKKPGTRDGEGGSKTGMRDGEGGKKTGARDGEGGSKTGMRDGEGGKKTGARDGEGGSKTGMRDGEGGKKTGARDGEGGSKTGMRDGEGGKKTGARDGEGGSKTGMRDGEGGKKTGARDGDKATGSEKAITLRVIKKGEAVMVGDEEVAMNRLRGHLSTFLPEHAGAKIIVIGEGDVPMSAMNNTVDAVRDNGNKNVGIQAE
ncbi:M56 family metallopeptidase [Prosthecobacter sp.]|uniref:M56 family metallopeptidase n=1 Tax=Prosthecobacter sp. TaxID=1965333 RepID=UPI00378417FE